MASYDNFGRPVNIINGGQLDHNTQLTPKVPGQATIRHIELRGEPVPENIYRFGKDLLLCANLSEQPDFIKKQNDEFNNRTIDKGSDYSDYDKDLVSELLSTKDTVIELQQENAELKEYYLQYQKIINTDYLFSSEKFLESWLEDNIHKILPEIEIIDRQPTITWKDGKFRRLDFVAKNKENNEVVIIEVKTRKRNKRSGFDQFVKYTTWMRQNKNKVEDKYKKHNVKVGDSPDFIIITDFIDDEIETICKDQGIKLVRLFGGLGFENVA